jgi:hypothetical protein
MNEELKEVAMASCKFYLRIYFEIPEETMDALSCNTEAGLFTDILPKMYQI